MRAPEFNDHLKARKVTELGDKRATRSDAVTHLEACTGAVANLASGAHKGVGKGPCDD